MGWAAGEPGLIAVKGGDFPLVTLWKLYSGAHVTYCTRGPVGAVGPFMRGKAVGA
jgi:hypothetical protein